MLLQEKCLEEKYVPKALVLTTNVSWIQYSTRMLIKGNNEGRSFFFIIRESKLFLAEEVLF